jgi:PAS domain S-box-containing protein
MNDQDRFTRDMPPPTAPGHPDDLPEFGARARRDFENSASPMRVFDHETLRYLAVNDAAVKFYGYSREEFLALTLKDTRHPDEHATQLASLKESASYFRYGKPRKQLKKSGEIAVVEVVTQDILFNGRKARLALTLDITERLRMQELLSQREQEFDSLMTHTPDIVARLDRDFRHLYVTPAITAATGRPPEEYIGKTIAELGLPPDLALRWDAALKKAFATGVEQSLECIFEGSSGARYYESRIVPELNADGGVATVLTITRDFTERKRVEELLWRREQEFESLAENLPDLVARFDREYRYQYANAAIEKTLGVDRAQIIGKTQREMGLPGEIASLFEDSLAGVFATRQPHKVEFRLALPSGERRFEAYHVAEMGVAGTVGSVLCVARDITERKRTEEELTRQKQILDAIVDNLPVSVFIRDAQTHRYVRRNRFAQSHFGQGKDISAGNTVYDLFLREQAEQILESDRRLFETGRMEEIPEQRVTDPQTGVTRIQHVRKVPLYNEKGEPWLVVGVADDITERKQEQALQSRLAAIVSHSMDAVISKDLDGIVRTWNPAAERLFGYRAEEAVGQPVTILIPPDRREEEALILERIRSGAPVEPFESVRCRKDGTQVDVSLSVSPIRDAAGKLVGASKIARDITERKQAELAVLRSAALARLLESLARAANEAVTPEAAMVACLERICQYGRWVIGRVEIFDRGRPKEAPGRSIWYAPAGNRFDGFIRITEGHVRIESGPFIGRVLRERTAVWIEDWRQTAGSRRWEAALSHGLRSAFAFPIIAGDEVVAIMEVFSAEARPQDPHIMGAAQSLASQLARIVEREWAHQANARMAAIVESSHDAIISRTLDGTILTWNPAAERLFGYTAAEIVGRKIEILYPPEIKAQMFHRQELLLKGLPVQIYETVRLARDGRRVHVSTSPAPIRDSSGNICGVSTIVQDITERKLAEQALRESEERFRQLAENIDRVFWINTPAIDDNLYVSPAYEKIWGKSRESLRRHPNSWKESIHPEDQLRAREAMARLAAEGVHIDVEYRIIRPDGTIRWIRDRSYPMKAGDGAPLVCGIAEDITARKQAEQVRLTHAIHQRDALVREVHHRIKNNLQGVAGLLRQKIRKFPAVAPGLEEAIVQLQTVAVVYGLQGTRADGLLGLAEMVEAICASAESLTGGQVDRAFQRKSARPACVSGSEAVSMAVALNELVFNALKHQRAPTGKKRAQVVLCEDKDAVDIRITNPGRLPKGFDFSAGRALGNGLELVRTLLPSPGASIEFNNGRSKVEVLVKLGPPLLAERQTGSKRSREHGGASEEKTAAAHPGRG